MSNESISPIKDETLYDSALENLTNSSINDKDLHSFSSSFNSKDFINSERKYTNSDMNGKTSTSQQPKQEINNDNVNTINNNNNNNTEPLDNQMGLPNIKSDNDILVINSDDESTIYSEFGSEFSDTSTTVFVSAAESNKSSLNTTNDNDTVDDDDDSSVSTATLSAEGAAAAAAAAGSSITVASANGAAVQDTTSTISNSEKEMTIYPNLDEFDKNLPYTVTKLVTPFGSQVYLVGTAHFSEESKNDVSRVIRNVQPDVVMVELCSTRVHMLKYDEKTLLEEASRLNISTIRDLIKKSGVVNGLFYVSLLNMSAKLTKEMGMAPGGEFRRAFREAHRIENCLFHLGDRPIDITLKRAMHALSYWQTFKIGWKLLTSNETFTQAEVEQCKQKDLLEEIMKEMAEEYPVFRDILVTERDMYLCHSLQMAATPRVLQPDGELRPVKVVGVVGIGHAAGIQRLWGTVDSNSIPEILRIPPPTVKHRIVKYTVKYSIFAALGYGMYRFVKWTNLHQYLIFTANK